MQALRAITSLDHYVTGFVLEEQAERRRYAETEETPPEEMSEEQLFDLLAATPTLAAAIREGGSPDGEAAFEEGLQLLIGGIAAEIAAPGRS